jgi:hypothetical protein
VVFGVVGIGLGGEMTYGQTLGFLRQPDTVWWGTMATSLKGAVWGLLGGIVLSLGFVHKKLKQQTIALALVLTMAGMYAGFKLINEPMLLYFSDPAKPRSESWAALLLGAITLLIFFRFVASTEVFAIIRRFALWGAIGGGLGFGLGGFWMVLGSQISGDIVFRSWWKMMEFTFGFLLGGFLGYASWKLRNQLKSLTNFNTVNEIAPKISVFAEMGVVLIVGLLIYWIIPASLEPIAWGESASDNTFDGILRGIAGMLVNYAFYGFLLILLALKIPSIAWQLGITLTFCHTMIDLGRDHIVKVVEGSPEIISLLSIIITTGVIAILTRWLRQKQNPKLYLFLLLIGSTVLVSKVKILFVAEKLELAAKSICQIVCGLYIVDIIFLVLAIVLSLVAIQKFTIKTIIE